MIAALALVLAFQQEPPVVDAAVYENAAWRVSLPRPFADWVFAPATARGTTTVIFQPRSGQLSDQLWGALVVTRWGGPVPLDSVADRRVRVTWRPALGSGFAVLARDTLDVDGWPAIHLVLSGAIARAVLDVEEFLVARDSDLVVLQLRYPRGMPRDSISAGYRRVVEGLRLGGPGHVAAPSPRAPEWLAHIEDGQVQIDLPEQLRAIVPGSLTAEATSGGRRLMRWRPAIGEPDTTLVAVGAYRVETRRLGRLTLRIWREMSGDTLVTRAGEEVVTLFARAWGVFWHDFGPLPITEVALVETAWAQTRGGAATVFLGADAAPPVIAREISRAWWGGAVRADVRNIDLVRDALPLFSAQLATGDSSSSDSTVMGAFARSRQIAGEPRFREAIRTFVAESRGGPAATDALLRSAGPNAANVLRQLIRHQ